jgi:flagellar motor switch protein FliN/FliY
MNPARAGHLPRPPNTDRHSFDSDAMPELTTANIESVVQACRDKIEAISRSLNSCFDTGFQLAAAEPQPQAAIRETHAWNGPGLVIAFNVGTSAMLCAISETLPLPAWYTEPDESESARLETLALEWSNHCLPDDSPGENFVCRAVPNLKECIASALLVEGAVCLPLLAGEPDAEAFEKIWLIWPAERLPVMSRTTRTDAGKARGPSAPVGPAGANRRTASPVDRLRKLPVAVTVRLAEKKVEISQLIGLGPGAIITFEKSCEDLLDLYVNNQIYCRGEAVKIGEKFGIKVCELGSQPVHASRVNGPL